MEDYGAPSTVPVWEMGKSGPRIKRHSSYWTDAKKFVEEAKRRGIVGIVFKNQYGKVTSCTILQWFRMMDLFDAGYCDVVDYVRNHHLHEYAGLQGYDTEGVNAFAHMGM